MKKIVLIICLLLLFSTFSIIPSSGSVNHVSINKKPVWSAWQSTTSYLGQSVTIAIAFNPASQAVVSFTLYDTGHNIISGATYASGGAHSVDFDVFADQYTVNFGSDHATIDGLLDR